jgi:hypothetical protein
MISVQNNKQLKGVQKINTSSNLKHQKKMAKKAA